jgi:hypothetical protein
MRCPAACCDSTRSGSIHGVTVTSGLTGMPDSKSQTALGHDEQGCRRQLPLSERDLLAPHLLKNAPLLGHLAYRRRR